LLERFGDGAETLASGHGSIPAMRFRLALPDHPVDIKGISDLG
jgi:CO/xanthine dehydrogenase FAD-binding subunit